MQSTYKVMFVCTGNTCRSPMAEGGLKKLLEKQNIDYIEVYSSGTSAALGFPPTEYAQEAARIWDADISQQRSQPLILDLIERADLILAMATSHCQEVLRHSPEAESKTFMLKNFPEPGCFGEDIDDPIGGSLDLYNQTFVEIGEELGRILPELIRRAKAKLGIE
jgi:protein-tyrosine-phosphatase